MKLITGVASEARLGAFHIMPYLGLVSASTGFLPRLEGCKFYELPSVLRMMRRFHKDSQADGFELGLLPEWDDEGPPLTPTSAPANCEKHTVKEICDAIEREGLRILTVHANRDVGAYLCLNTLSMVAKGERLAEEALEATQRLGARVCVFHIWPSWKESFDVNRLLEIYARLVDRHAEIEVSVENVPTVNKNQTPFSLAEKFKHITLDLKWASMYNEFEQFIDVMERVDNIHVQGKHTNDTFTPSTGALNYDDAFRRIKRAGYDGLLTIELEGTASYESILSYISKLKRLVT
jgi:sugar phosphate isomerase/epimerase